LTPNLWVYTPPPAIPLNRLRQRNLFALVLRLNQAVYRLAVRRAMRRLDMNRPLLWIALEPLFGAGLIGRIGERMVLYHCTDDLEAFGTYNPAVGALERDVARRADLVVSTSEQLQELMGAHNPNSHCVPNAVEVDRFRAALADLPEPPDLQPIPRPRAIYTGQLEGRVDLELLRELTIQAPEISFVFVGLSVPAIAGEIASWGRPNISLLGPKPHEAIPAYLRWSDAALIPHRLNELTRKMYPLKLHEYLAAGKPVVSTILEPLLPFRDVVTLAASTGEFVAAVRSAVVDKEPQRVARRVAVAEANDWDARARAVAQLIGGAAARGTPAGPRPANPRPEHEVLSRRDVPA
jgi:glycosyltransferase involved in cell wall biosynthesis